MLAIPGFSAHDTCDGVSRRDLLRIGGSSVLGISLANVLALQALGSNNAPAPKATPETTGGKGFGKAFRAPANSEPANVVEGDVVPDQDIIGVECGRVAVNEGSPDRIEIVLPSR